MKVVLTNLSNKLYEQSRLRLNNSARQHGISEINSFDFEDLKKYSFYEENKRILDAPKGIGYWLWKPFIILETMKSICDDDIIVYSDCGIELIENLDPLISICKEQQPVLLFANENLKNKFWTKRDCFVLMNCDSKKYWNGLQSDAAFSLFRKSEKSIQFLNEWLKYSTDERILTSQPNVCGKKNFFGFKEHRWDQSVLSLLAIKHDIELFRVPTQFGNHYKAAKYRIKGEFNCVNQVYQKQVNFYSSKPYTNSPYPQLLNHHRTKENTDTIVEKKSSVLKKVIKSGKRRWGKTVRFISRT
jgi:hypothetical protein